MKGKNIRAYIMRYPSGRYQIRVEERIKGKYTNVLLDWVPYPQPTNWRGLREILKKELNLNLPLVKDVKWESMPLGDHMTTIYFE